MRNRIVSACIAASMTLLVQLPFSRSASAVIVPDTQISFGPVASDEYANYAAGVRQTLAGDITGILFSFSSNTLRATGWNLDEESDWYLANLGDTFAPSTIAASQFPIIFTTDRPRPPVAVPLGSFYLAVSTGVGSINGYPKRDVFGWLQLYNDGTTLTPITSAVAYNEPGIIIGSSSPIPEPTSALLFLPLLSLTLKRRNTT